MTLDLGTSGARQRVADLMIKLWTTSVVIRRRQARMNSRLRVVRPDLSGALRGATRLDRSLYDLLREDPRARGILQQHMPAIAVTHARLRRVSQQWTDLKRDLEAEFGERAVADLIDSVAEETKQAALLVQLRGPRQRELRMGRPTRRLTRLAGWVAGPQHSHLSGAWLADLAGDPDSGLTLTGRGRLALAAGFVVAALRLRLRDATRRLWCPVDWLIATDSRVHTAITMLVGTLAIYIRITGGLAELLGNGIQTCAVAGASLYALSRWLRRIRGIELASRPPGEQE